MKLNELSDFNSLSEEKYLFYMDWAMAIHNKGLHCDKSVLELAILIYEKEKLNENKKSC